MIYNASNKLDVQKAREKLEWLIKNEKRFKLTQKRERRSIPLNNFLHVVLSSYALFIGETLEYVKQVIFKQIVCKQIFEYERVNPKTGEIRIAYKSTADMDSKELSDAIAMFRNHSLVDVGYYIPDPTDLAAIDQMEREIEMQKQWL